MHLRTIEWVSSEKTGLIPGYIRMIDQTKLPCELVYIETADVQEVWAAIKQLRVRGAPAIGIAAAMGVVAAIQNPEANSHSALLSAVSEACDYLTTSRPTAINLFWALERMKKIAGQASNRSVSEIKNLLAEEAVKIRDEDAAMCRAIGRYGSTLLKDGQAVLTHCNAGGLATAEYGTALAPIYAANEQGKNIHVYVDETRPLLQGSRLTAWELLQAGIDLTLICDNMAGQVMKEGRIGAVMVGADRIAANGDTANKIGTYGLGVLAQFHHIPFYVLAPTSSFDLSLASGEVIPIEQRDPEEVTEGFGKRTAPRNVRVYSPAFDVTPCHLITAIVCEKGIAYPPFTQTLEKFL